jgi:hypothetical protein
MGWDCLDLLGPHSATLNRQALGTSKTIAVAAADAGGAIGAGVEFAWRAHIGNGSRLLRTIFHRPRVADLLASRNDAITRRGLQRPADRERKTTARNDSARDRDGLVVGWFQGGMK